MHPLRRSVTLRDVALQAKVSVSTVSRVLNAKPLSVPITEDTRARVLETARILGYRANRLARGLVTARTNIVGIRLPIYVPLEEASSMIPTWYRMGFAAVGAQIAGVQSVMYPRNYDLHLFQEILDPDAAYSLSERTPDLVDGLILPNPDPTICSRLAKWGVHTVTIDYNPPEFSREFGLSSVYLDSLGEFYRVFNGWIALGQTRIGLILFGASTDTEGKYQLMAYKRALADAGLPFDERLVVEGSADLDRGQMLARRLLSVSVPPSAIFVGRADNAVDVLRGIREAGKRCPDDVEIVVWCSDHAFEATDPPLAALDVPFHRLGMQAAELLLEEIGQTEHEVTQRVVACRLVPRASCRLSMATDERIPR